jgi:hypothetical protein
MIFEPATRSASPSIRTAESAAFCSRDGSLQRVDARRQGQVVQGLFKLGPRVLADLARSELIDRPAREDAEPIDVEIVERHTDDAAARDEADAREVEEPRHELPAREITGRAEEHDDLGKLRTDPGGDAFHV